MTRQDSSGPSPNGFTVLTCRAPHPRAAEGGRFQGRPHGVRLQVVPFEARPTYRRVSSWSDAFEGCLAVRCHSCGEFTEYEIVGPLPTGRGAGDDTSVKSRSRSAPRAAAGSTAIRADGGASPG